MGSSRRSVAGRGGAARDIAACGEGGQLHYHTSCGHMVCGDSVIAGHVRLGNSDFAAKGRNPLIPAGDVITSFLETTCDRSRQCERLHIATRLPRSVTLHLVVDTVNIGFDAGSGHEPMMSTTTIDKGTIDKSNERVQRMFGEIAPSYDRMNHLLSLNVDRYWRWWTVRKLAPATGRADSGCLHGHGRFGAGLPACDAGQVGDRRGRLLPRDAGDRPPQTGSSEDRRRIVVRRSRRSEPAV